MSFCWLGFHDWLYIPLTKGERRICLKCAKKQTAYLYEFYGMYYVRWK